MIYLFFIKITLFENKRTLSNKYWLLAANSYIISIKNQKGKELFVTEDETLFQNS